VSIKQILLGAAVHGEKKNKNTQIVLASHPVADIDSKITFRIQHTTLSDSNLGPNELVIKVPLRVARPGAWRRIAFQGRIVVCGVISTYNDADAQGTSALITQRARMEGFIETVVHGIENAPDAPLVSLFKGDNMGRCSSRTI
ncbi:hypothetical protein BG006_002158, partial [Podila minutissima]